MQKNALKLIEKLSCGKVKSLNIKETFEKLCMALWKKGSESMKQKQKQNQTKTNKQTNKQSNKKEKKEPLF